MQLSGRAATDEWSVTVADPQPSWQLEPCPSWCTGGHGVSDHPDDRVHRSGFPAVDVVMRQQRLEGDRLERDVTGQELEVALSRATGSGESWVYIGIGPERSLEITQESAERLLEALRGRLTALRSR
jgi:hypothetical protein